MALGAKENIGWRFGCWSAPEALIF